MNNLRENSLATAVIKTPKTDHIKTVHKDTDWLPIGKGYNLRPTH